MDAEGDELDEEEHVGDGDARQEAVDGRTVHLLACEHGDVEQVLGCYSVVLWDFYVTLTYKRQTTTLLNIGYKLCDRLIWRGRTFSGVESTSHTGYMFNRVQRTHTEIVNPSQR